MPPTANPLAVLIQGHLKKVKKASIYQLSETFDVSPHAVRDALSQLSEQFVNVHVKDSHALLLDAPEPEEPTKIDMRKRSGKWLTFGITADNHLCSKYARMDVLNALFDIWEDEGVETVYQLGNMVDGEASFNRYDLIAHGMEGQLEYFVNEWPHRKGITTEFVTGDDHEGWWVQREGVNVGRNIDDIARRAGRSDLVYLGHMEHDLYFEAPGGTAVARLVHAGGGTAHAVSYSTQQIVNSYQGGEKPNILLVGHYHKFEFGYPREVYTIQAGCTQDQSPFMRKKKIQAHVGGVTVRMRQDDCGIITDFNVTWHPFFDRDFYKGTTWKHAFERDVPPTAKAGRKG